MSQKLEDNSSIPPDPSTNLSPQIDEAGAIFQFVEQNRSNLEMRFSSTSKNSQLLLEESLPSQLINRIKHLEEELMEAHRKIEILEYCLEEKTAEAIQNKDIAYGFKFEYEFMVEQNRIKEEIIEEMERQNENVHDGSDEERGATFVADETSEEKEEEQIRPCSLPPQQPPQSKSIEQQSLLTKTHLSPTETNLIDLMNGDYEFVSVADRYRLCEYVATSAQISKSTIISQAKCETKIGTNLIKKLNYYYLYNSIDNEMRIELERLDYSKIALQSACFAAKRRNRGETLAILRKPINENMMIELLKRVKEDEGN